MNGETPHMVQYQGSERLLAPQILQYMPVKFNRLIEASGIEEAQRAIKRLIREHLE